MNMKYMRKTIFFLAFYLALSSCTNEEKILDIALQGTWNMTEIQGSLSKPTTYEYGKILWVFDMNKKKLTITNTIKGLISTGNGFSKNETGVYLFTIEEENEEKILVVGNRKGKISLSEDTLKINYGLEFDDVLYTLKR